MRNQRTLPSIHSLRQWGVGCLFIIGLVTGCASDTSNHTNHSVANTEPSIEEPHASLAFPPSPLAWVKETQ